MSGLSESLQYTFRDPSLLRLALTHPSVSPVNNQRLEFLGDAVLEYIISDTLYASRPKSHEGELTRLRIRLVCEETLSGIARRMGIGQALILTDARDQAGLREKPSVLCDTLEAVLAAVYLDGGLAACREIVQRCWPSVDQLQAETRPPKSILQEFVQRDGAPAPVYVLLSKRGPDHAPVFESAVLVAGEEIARGTGSSKQQAETAAAEAAILRLGAQ